MQARLSNLKAVQERIIINLLEALLREQAARFALRAQPLLILISTSKNAVVMKPRRPEAVRNVFILLQMQLIAGACARF